MAKETSVALRCDPDNNIYCVVFILDGDEIYCPVEKTLYEEVKQVPSGDYPLNIELHKPLFQFDGRERLVRLSMGGQRFEIPVSIDTYDNISAHDVCELT